MNEYYVLQDGTKFKLIGPALVPEEIAEEVEKTYKNNFENKYSLFTSESKMFYQAAIDTANNYRKCAETTLDRVEKEINTRKMLEAYDVGLEHLWDIRKTETNDREKLEIYKNLLKLEVLLSNEWITYHNTENDLMWPYAGEYLQINTSTLAQDISELANDASKNLRIYGPLIAECLKTYEADNLFTSIHNGKCDDIDIDSCDKDFEKCKNVVNHFLEEHPEFKLRTTMIIDDDQER